MSYLCVINLKHNKQINNYSKLSFSQLEEEMEALKEQDAQSCIGGFGWWDYVNWLDPVTVVGGGGFMPSDFQSGG